MLCQMIELIWIFHYPGGHVWPFRCPRLACVRPKPEVYSQTFILKGPRESRMITLNLFFPSEKATVGSPKTPLKAGITPSLWWQLLTVKMKFEEENMHIRVSQQQSEEALKRPFPLQILPLQIVQSWLSYELRFVRCTSQKSNIMRH